MTNRKATLSLLYTNSSSASWVRTLSEFIDEGMAALCMRQWQRVPVPFKPAEPVLIRNRRGRV